MATLKLNGIECTLTLGPDEGGYRNGKVSLPDGRKFAVGGGNIHTAESALASNRQSGLQTDTHPEIHWPGAQVVGDFDAYDGYGLGDLDGLAEAVGINIDRDTPAGDRNWRELVLAVQVASEAAAQLAD